MDDLRKVASRLAKRVGVNGIRCERVSMTAITCPECGNRFDSKLSESMPFCSRFCQKSDLANWLDEGYGMPQEDLISDRHEQNASLEEEDQNQ